jgi:hypothetical protein
MILTKERDPRLVTVRRGGSRQDSDHHLLAVWAAGCAMHVLHFFEEAQPDDDRPRRAIELTHAWVRGEITMTQARSAALAANAARQGGDRSRQGSGPWCRTSRGGGTCAAYELGAAAYAIRTVRAAASADGRDEAGRLECQWQRVSTAAEF